MTCGYGKETRERCIVFGSIRIVTEEMKLTLSRRLVLQFPVRSHKIHPNMLSTATGYEGGPQRTLPVTKLK